MPAPVTTPEHAPASPATLEAQIVELVREILIEQGKDRVARSVTARSSFQKDLGLASLDLVELVVRCEAKLEIEVTDEIAEQGDTPAAWAKAIREGSEDKGAQSVYRIVPPSGEPVAIPEHATTLTEVLAFHAERSHGRVHIHLLEEGSGRGITCDQLLEASTRVARGLISLGLCRNDTVAILLPTGSDFVEAFFGVMLAGGIAVPVYPPANLNRLEEYIARQIHILGSAGIRFLVSFDRARQLSRLLRVHLPSLIEVTTVPELKDYGMRTSARLPNPSSTALIQYTSGTTDSPRGAALTHEGILTNIRAIGTAVSAGPNDAVVSWLPLSSDLGLVGCWLFSLYHGTPLTLLSPQEFLERPESWFWAIHDSRGTLSAAPNFAYELCARRVPMWTLDGIDLSSWRVAVNAGEAVSPATVERFTRRFAPVGFRAEAVTPAYGLAENSVALTFPPAGRGPILHNGVYSVGAPLPGHEVRIVDDAGHDHSEGETGRLWFRGPSRCGGYFNNEKATAEAMRDGWMESGDLAFCRGGEIYITGRTKDVILREGRSIAPEPIESAVSRVSGVVANSVAVIGLPGEGTERIAVIAETDAQGVRNLARVEASIRNAVAGTLGFTPDEIRLIPEDTLPKTSNGKIRRSETKRLFTQGTLGREAGSPALQMASLWWQNIGALAGRGISRMKRTARGAVQTGVARAAARFYRLSGTRAGAQRGARAVLSILGRRPTPEGTQMRGPAVIVSNRSNLLDALSVVSLVENEAVLAGSEALLGLPTWAARLLDPLVATSRQQIENELRAGKTILLFPEAPLGTPVARCRYRLNAIEAAIATGHPLVPFGMQIIRNKLFFRLNSPIATQGTTARELRNRVRQAIREIYA